MADAEAHQVLASEETRRSGVVRALIMLALAVIPVGVSNLLIHRLRMHQARTRSGEQRLASITEIGRLDRLYSARSGINQAIVLVRSREDLFRRVCEVLVETGGFRMA
jgi:hypothetical protein